MKQLGVLGLRRRSVKSRVPVLAFGILDSGSWSRILGLGRGIVGILRGWVLGTGLRGCFFSGVEKFPLDPTIPKALKSKTSTNLNPNTHDPKLPCAYLARIVRSEPQKQISKPLNPKL